MTGPEFLMLAGVALFSAAGQLLLRRAATVWRTGNGLTAFIGSFLRSSALPALILVLGAPVLYWKALETVPLSRAYAITALTGVLVQAGGWMFLHEKVNRRHLAGALLCCAGIALWGL